MKKEIGGILKEKRRKKERKVIRGWCNEECKLGKKNVRKALRK